MGLLKRLGQLGMLASAAKMVQRQLNNRRPAGATRTGTTATGGANRSWQQTAQQTAQRLRDRVR